MAIIKRVFSPPDHLAAQLVDPDDDDVEGSNKRWSKVVNSLVVARTVALHCSLPHSCRDCQYKQQQQQQQLQQGCYNSPSFFKWEQQQNAVKSRAAVNSVLGFFLCARFPSASN
jgi:hypothetical protein